MNALTLVLLLVSTNPQVPAQTAPAGSTNAGVKTGSESTASKTASKGPDAKKADVQKDEKADCDGSSPLVKALSTGQQENQDKEQKEAADKAVAGLLNLGVVPADKVEEKKSLPVIAVPKMENCQ
jgi:hypothetical protein